ncbi:MAG: ABC transporter ATP-binding protein [Actinobacteria bacterium]|nr:ABC transporter ATP-binding protein [Actinomycetota bacterium]
MSELLQLKAVSKNFGGLRAVNHVDMVVPEKGLYGLIGPNGAGKTTIFNLITGIYEPTEGEIIFDGSLINGLQPHSIAKRGIARTFQNIRLFKELTVLENILIARQAYKKYNIFTAMFRLPGYFKEEKRMKEEAMEILGLLGLADKADYKAGALPYGEQRLTEIARALALRPKLILLDEPAAGMNPAESENLMNLIKRIREEFITTVLLIEHDMKVVMGVCEYIYVLDYGSLISQGPPEVVSKDPKVIEAYLGEQVNA